MRMLIMLAAVCFALAPAPGQSAEPLPASAFSYNTAAPLRLAVISQRRDGGAAIREISFASPLSGRIHAEILAPLRPPASHPGVLFVHWLGDAKTTNLTEFYPDALALARHGFVSLLVDAQWAQPHWYEKIRSPRTDYPDSLRQVIDLRRSLDVLSRQPGVDPKRIAFVGHDFGAMYGAVLSGVDPRPSAYVLMAGNPSFSEWFLLFPKLAQPQNRTAYLAQMTRLDPPLYLARSRAQGFLLQFARHDDYIAPARAAAFSRAVLAPRRVLYYASDHSLNVPAARNDRLEWLRRRLAARD